MEKKQWTGRRESFGRPVGLKMVGQCAKNTHNDPELTFQR